MRELFKQKPVFVKEKTWKEFKKVAKFYGREIPFALDEALLFYVKTKKKEIEKQNEIEE